MSDQRGSDQRGTPGDLPRGEIDPTGEPTGLEQVQPPQQAPMDEAAGGPDVDEDDTLGETGTDDLTVQGGE